MKKIFTFQVVYFLALVACVSGLLAVFPGHARATLFSPSVEATTNAHGAQTNASQPSGPVVLANSGTHYSFGVWTDYGINRAESNLSLSTFWSSPVAYGSAVSKWTDVLTINVPNLSYGTPLSFLFSFRLDGSLSAHEDDFTVAIAEVRFYSQTAGIDGIYGSLPPYFITTINPTPSTTAGGDASAVIDEILYGNYTIHNGEPFNLIAVLDTRAWGTLMGPPGSMSAVSLFGSSAEYLGGSVEANGAPVSTFTITSGSGFNYGGGSTTPVPEPSTLLLLGSGLVGLAGIRKRFKT